MPISYTQSYLNQLPWATRMVCELSAYSAGKGQPEESTLLPQLFTHSSLESLDWRNKNSNQEKNLRAACGDPGIRQEPWHRLLWRLPSLNLSFHCSNESLAILTWWSVEGTFAHPTVPLDSITSWCSKLFHGVQKSQSQTSSGGEGLQTFKSHLWLGAFTTVSVGKTVSEVF